MKLIDQNETSNWDFQQRSQRGVFAIRITTPKTVRFLATVKLMTNFLCLKKQIQFVDSLTFSKIAISQSLEGHVSIKLNKFFDDESGAVTVDWIALTAAAMALVLLIFATIQDSSVELAEDIQGDLTAMITE